MVGQSIILDSCALEEGFGYNGGDISGYNPMTSVTSVEECCSLCQGHGDCILFSWFTDNRCYLKDTKGTLVQWVASPILTMGRKGNHLEK